MAVPLLSLIVPAYNEATRLGNTIEQALAYLQAQPYRSEVIVVNDGSTDNTTQVAEAVFAAQAGRIATRLLSYQPNRGKGYAVRQGLLAAQGQVALFSDADLSTPIDELPQLLNPILAGQFDIVFGSRALDPSLVGTHQPWLREQSGRFFNLVMRLATGLPYVDTQCGFKAFRLDVCRPIAEGAILDRFGFDVELLYLAYKAGLRLHEQPVRWNDAAGSKVGVLGGLDGFRELHQLRRRARRGRYDDTLRRTREAMAKPAPLLQPEP
ncbi:dolichyl-phosphate beta-glucosyltransferase [Hymenobacter ruricola]|uniref:dolichyl-phosphate beta-glucosyltransferase n=1 Tax=Hymenobacter ruricola TaxID=2791023 RepID=A0ABS0I9W3_9BACT|nr:dolichyl-phosphate beta-glucosyltransferase [Hymenobacter ruricola]MBF9223733.1 glycosyltransferase family 2 protein [Hymenobacter ruricola]